MKGKYLQMMNFQRSSNALKSNALLLRVILGKHYALTPAKSKNTDIIVYIFF